MSPATLSELLDALDSGARLLLPNARAARALRSTFDARQKRNGLSAWEPPQVLSWSQWTNSLWSELIIAGAESRPLLNAAQEHSLWQEIVAEDAMNSLFGSADSMAELARSAWQLAAGYSVRQQLRRFAATHDSRIFAEWAETFSKRCAERGYLSAALLDTTLLEHLQAGTLAAPGSLELVGFGEMRPSQRMLLAAFRERKTDVIERSLEVRVEDRGLRASVAAVNEREEFLLAARWIRGFLEEMRTKECSAHVAVLVPNLYEERAELEEVLRETLAPELQSIGADLSSRPWEFSSGVPLSSLAMVADALSLARWAEGPLPLARVSSLLLSPYVGRNGVSSEDRDANARFDANRLRRMPLLRSEIGISAVLELADCDTQTFDEKTLLAWLRNVQEFLQRTNDRNRLRSFAEWMEFVRGLMRAANWPGDRALTASEFETTHAWESMLDLVSTLDFSGRRVVFASALEALEQQAHMIFTPPTMDAPVQIMNIAEAEGSIFDAVVFLCTTDENWPASERMNPLLPWALQQSLKMPDSDSALAAARSRAFTDDLLRRSGDVLFTYAMEDASGKLRPSPLLAEMRIEHVDAERLVPPAWPVETVTVENRFDDSVLPELPSNEIAGGAAVLKLQAACGFLAFAELRLRATEPKRGSMGLDAGESGTLIHRVLQNFWKEVETQEALRSKSWSQRDRILAHAIDEALPRGTQMRDGWDRAYLALLKDRLRSLLQQWIEEELKRGPFRVLAMERDQVVTVGPLTLNVRVDRIDKVGDGVFLVDYKTGYAADPKQWMGDRPDDPQLPLYTLLPEAVDLKGMAFAKVRAGREMRWLGYQVEEGILPRSKNVKDLASLVEEWRGTLTQLAEDFAAGRADVQPKSFEQNCARCAQRLLCRLDPTLLLTSMDEDDEAGEDIDG